MSEKRPTISVIVPAYNVEKYIEATVESIFGQTEPFHEVIIINDGSTDKTREKLESYTKQDRITIIHTPNRGLGLSRNEGLQFASGDLVYFLDSADLIPSNFVEQVVGIFRERPNIDLLLFSGEIFFDDGDEDDRVEERWKAKGFYRRVNGIYPSGLDAAAALLETGIFAPNASLYVSRRNLWNEELHFQPTVHEDDAVITQLCFKAKTTCIADQAFYKHRIRTGSTMNTKTSRRNSDGYFAALRSTWRTYRAASNPPHRSIILHQFRAQASQYLNACRQAGILPRPAELLFLLKRWKTVPKSDFLRTVVPTRAYKWIRNGKKLLTSGVTR